MPICVTHREPVRASREAAFSLIDDLPRTAEWLPPCVSLRKLGSGPNAVGDQLRYTFIQGGRESEMTGVIVAREPGRLLHCRYSDRMFDVSVDLGVETVQGQTVMVHTVAITPKTLLGRLMSPLIRLGLKRQTREAASHLRRLLESPAVV